MRVVRSTSWLLEVVTTLGDILWLKDESGYTEDRADCDCVGVKS